MLVVINNVRSVKTVYRTITVWSNSKTGEIHLAKDNKTGKFLSVNIAKQITGVYFTVKNLKDIFDLRNTLRSILNELKELNNGKQEIVFNQVSRNVFCKNYNDDLKNLSESRLVIDLFLREFKI